MLGDKEKRKEYDEVRRLGPAAAGFGAQGAQSGGFNFQTGDFGDLGDLFGGLFGGARRQRAQRGADLETALHLGFRDAVVGVTTSVNLPSNEACHTCKGSGAAPGTGFVDLRALRRTRRLNDDQGPFAMSSVCPVCQGRGGRIVTPCPTCHGTGREPSSRKVNVRIPAGVNDGQRIKIKGKGNPGTQGGPAGDLFVDVHVSPDAAIRTTRAQCHDDGQRAAHGRDARHDGRSADAGRAGDAEGARRDPALHDDARARSRRARQRQERRR